MFTQGKIKLAKFLTFIHCTNKQIALQTITKTITDALIKAGGPLT